MKLDRVIAVRNHKTVYRDGDKAIKVFDGTFPKSDILNEALNHARVEETGLNVPGLLEVAKIDGKWAIVYDFIAGKTMQQVMDEKPEEMDALLEQFVDIQAEIHAKRAPLLGKIRDKMQAKISQTDLDATTRYELHMRLDGMPRRDKVLHGDFNPSNIILREDGEVFILDWSHATQGNASADAARTYLLFSLEGKAELAERYMRLFCKKEDIALQYVQKWLPIVAASQSVKGKAEEREFLRKWADVVEYE